MKCKIPEISWHNRDPVLSVDIQPKTNASNNYYRLASSGTDAHVLIWYMKLTLSGEYGDIELDLAADLARHQRAVNVVKWSPSGELLASGDDESVVFIWKQKSDSEPLNILDSTNEQDKEVWITLKVLRGHMEDIYDLSWAPNSLYLVTGSVDNSAIIWDVQKGKSMAILKDHKGFVQGVAWDPKNQYVATLSTDRYMRIFDIQTKKVLYRVSKGTLPVTEDNYLHGKRMRLYHDDTLQTFFRRLSFTPDGKLLLTPAGVTDYDGCSRPLNTTYAFSRYGFRQPAIVLPCPDQYTVAVKCCPLLYKLRPFNAEKNPPVVPLPYRMIFAVATKSSVYFYDTQQKQPFAVISNIHYTRLTDVTWSNDGRIVVVSSTDGFCSLITFEQGELGEEYEDSEAALEAALAQVTKKTKKQKDSEVTAKSRKPSTDDTNAAVQKETATVQKEGQLEAVVEEQTKETLVEIKENPDTTEKSKYVDEDREKFHNSSVDGKSIEKEAKKEDEKEKKVSSNLEQVINDDKSIVAKTEDDNKPKPIAIKRKPGPTTEFTNKTAENKPELKATPKSIKRKAGSPVNNDVKNETSSKTTKETTPKTKKTNKISPKSNNDSVEDKNIEKEAASTLALEKESEQDNKVSCNLEKVKDDDKPTVVKAGEDKPKPIAIKRKAGSTTESTNNTAEEKSELKAKPLAIKRKPGSPSSNDAKNETSNKTTKDTTPKNNKISQKSNNDSVEDKSIEKDANSTQALGKEGEQEKNVSCYLEKIKDDDKPIVVKAEDDKPKPIAIKRKPGPTTESTYKTAEDKPELKATPAATKRKPGSPTNNDAKNETSGKTTKETTPKTQKTNKVSPKSKNDFVDDKSIKKETAFTQALGKVEQENKISCNLEEVKDDGKPESTNNTDEENPELKAAPIGIKRKPGSPTNCDEKSGTCIKTTEETTPSKTAAILPNKVLAADIIIDKEILSSDERFESPEKKSRAATPITIRRHPRTPNSLPPTPTSMTNILKNQVECNNQSPVSSLSKEIGTPLQDKRAKPIAVRRTPRAIIAAPSTINTTSLVDEAMDAWPISMDDNAEIVKETLPDAIKKPFTEAGITPLLVSETTCERTEDIRLVYEETNEETPVKESLLPKPLDVEENKSEIVEKSTVDPPQSQTPSGNKTPRRVALKTISTPKSKKKLID